MARYVKRPRVALACARCGGEIPHTRRSDARYCSLACSSTAGVVRHINRDPVGAKARKALDQKKRRLLSQHGHLDYLESDELNPRDIFRSARVYGMRSMLEVNLARQLEAAGFIMKNPPRNWAAKKHGTMKVVAKLRSGLEDKVAAQLNESGISFTYEGLKLPYSIEHTYNPDFQLKNGIIVECKGLFESADRTKHLAVKKHHPHLDIRFVFSRSASPLYKGSKSTYASWCDKHGFPYADKLIPEAWLREKK